MGGGGASESRGYCSATGKLTEFGGGGAGGPGYSPLFPPPPGQLELATPLFVVYVTLSDRFLFPSGYKYPLRKPALSFKRYKMKKKQKTKKKKTLPDFF